MLGSAIVAVGSIASVVRMPKVKPCKFSGVGTVHKNILNVPMNWMVPWPSDPVRSIPDWDSDVSVPPQWPTSGLTMVKGESRL